jgi:hypothetical protein
MAYADVVLADSPMLYWRLGESSGTLAEDASPNNRDGTYAGSGVTYSQTGALIGDANTSVLFNGTAGEVHSAASVSPISSSIVTLECWVNFPSFNNSDDLLAELSDDFNSHNGVFLNDPCAGDGTWTLAINNTTITARTFTRPSTGVFHHFVFVFDISSGTTRFVVYVDNVVQTLSGSGNVSSGTFQDFPLFIGSRNAAALFLNATVDEVAFYASELSAARVLAHYNAGLGIFAAQPSDNPPMGIGGRGAGW